MIILSITAILLAGALLALMLRIAGEAEHTLDVREGPEPQPDPSRRPLPPPIFDRAWYEDLR